MTVTGPSTTATVDLAAVKRTQQRTWASGDYAVIGTSLQLVGELLCEAVDISAGSDVLDVAAGNGNAALAAARRGAVVTACDYVEALLGRARDRAAADGLALKTDVADAEALPYADASFDVVLSTFGVMFAPDQLRAASELVRVCRPGGRIGLASWTPTGFVGRMFRIVGGHAPPPAGLASPTRWGSAEHLDVLLGAHTDITTAERSFTFRFRSAEQLVETFRTYYGPVVKACEALDPAGRESLEAELVELARAANRASDGTLAIDATYLEATARRRR
jgi:ubiquinone/menaquinone biosynthesis C-methylase UbiE